VVTAWSSTSAPALPTANHDPAANLGLPFGYVIAPFDTGWDNLTLPASTMWGFRLVTPPGASEGFLTVFQASPADVPALLKALGPTTVTPGATKTTVDGVTVLIGASGSEALFQVGTRVFDVSISDALATGATDAQKASLREIVEALIAGAGTR